MIGKQKWGHNATRLVRYLLGPGKAEEHTEPQLVAASGSLLEEFPGVLTATGDLAVELAHELDQPWREFGDTGDEKHLLSVPLSAAVEDGRLSLETWGQVATEYVEAMGWAHDSRWIAVHHGLSKGGNDHIHLVVELVDEQGGRLNEHRSKIRGNAALREIEKRHGLRVLGEEPTQRGLPGASQPEVQRAARLGRAEPDRVVLGRMVRAAAVGAHSEAEFVSALLAAGVVINPRHATGPAGAAGPGVVGYSVALPVGRREAERPGVLAGDAELYLVGGGKLGRDLTLPELRKRWPTPDADQQASDQRVWSQARARYYAAKGARGTAVDGKVEQSRGRLGVNAGESGGWGEAVRVLGEANELLGAAALQDRATWRAAAAEAAGALGAWSSVMPPAQARLLGRASDALARSAIRPGSTPSHRGDGGDMVACASRAVALMVAATSSSDLAGWAAVARQLQRMTRAIRVAHEARAEAAQATWLRQDAEAMLAQVIGDLDDQLAGVGASATPVASEVVDRGDSTSRGGRQPASSSPYGARSTEQIQTDSGHGSAGVDPGRGGGDGR